MPSRPLAFSSVVLDVDSTLCGIEGIDFLAARRGASVGAEIARITDRTMRGEVPLERVYAERLTIIQPTRADIAALVVAYAGALAPGAAEALERMRAQGVRLALVSGGIRQAIEPIARTLGVADDDLCAVCLSFDDEGRYVSFDARSPLTTQAGKGEIIRRLLSAGRLSRPLLAVGDGSTDVAMADVADAFGAYTGFARRANVVDRADVEVKNFAQLVTIVTDGLTG